MASSMLPPRRGSRAIGNEVDRAMADLDVSVRAKALAEGDVEFVALLDKMEDASTFQNATEDLYEMVENEVVNKRTGNRSKNWGQLGLERKDAHGLSNRSATVNAILMALDSELHGPVVVGREGRPPTWEDKALERIMRTRVDQGTKTHLAGLGLSGDRGGTKGFTQEDKTARAIRRVLEMSHGYDPISGAPHRGVPVEGGHIYPHSKYPALSRDINNMFLQNNYANVVANNREGAEVATSFVNALRKRYLTGSARRDPLLPAADLVDKWQVNMPYEVYKGYD